MTKWLPPNGGGYTAKPGPTSKRLPPKSRGGATLARSAAVCAISELLTDALEQCGARKK